MREAGKILLTGMAGCLSCWLSLEAVREGLGSQLERMRLPREMWYNRSR